MSQAESPGADAAVVTLVPPTQLVFIMCNASILELLSAPTGLLDVKHTIDVHSDKHGGDDDLGKGAQDVEGNLIAKIRRELVGIDDRIVVLRGR